MKTPYLFGVVDCRERVSKFTGNKRPTYNITVCCTIEELLAYLRHAHRISETQAAITMQSLDNNERCLCQPSFIAFTSPDVFELCHAIAFDRRISKLAFDKVIKWIKMVCNLGGDTHTFIRKINDMDGLQRVVFETNFNDLSGSVAAEPSDAD